jgi:hypothetical protein
MSATNKIAKALPTDGSLPPAKGPGLLSPSDWSLLPTWFHFATGWYFASNCVMIYGMSKVAPSKLAAVLGIGGLCVGFVEVSWEVSFTPSLAGAALVCNRTSTKTTHKVAAGDLTRRITSLEI